MDQPTSERRPTKQDLDRRFDTTHLTSDLGRHTIRGAAWITGAYGVRFVLEAAQIIVLARLLQPADYGLIAMVTVVTGFIAMFQDLGLDMATVTREKITHAEVSTLFWANLVIGLGLVAATGAIAPLLAWFYHDPRLSSITLVLAPNFLLAGLAIQHQALLRRQMCFRALAFVRVSSVTGGLIVGIAMAYHGAGYWSLVGRTVASVATNAMGVWVAAGWRPGPPMRGVGVGEMLRFGTHVTGTNLVNYLSGRLDQLLLGWWWGAIPLGLYTKANSLLEALTGRALNPINAVVVPSLSRLGDQPERYRAAYLRVLEKMALVLMPGAVFMIGAAEWLIPFLLGPRWVEAAPIFGALAVLSFLRPLEGSGWWLFVTQNRADEALLWSLLKGFVTGLAVVAGLPWGSLGVAISLAFSSLVRIPLIVWYMTRRGPVRAGDVYRTLATPALASICSLGVLIALAPQASGQPPALVLTAGLIVTGTVVLAILCALPAGRRALLDSWVLLQRLGGQQP